MKVTKMFAAGVATLALIASACGSSGGDEKSDDKSTTTAADKSEGDKSSGAVSTIGDVESAVVQIVATGSFVEPDGSLAVSQTFEGSSRGTGFIIDPSGIVVTNNHVVTGNATLKVHLSGEDKPVNAKVLGVSECSDLAVIDLEGDGYPYLEWSNEAPKVGLEVRAAGFPLGDPEYTLTSGIISKAEAAGDTNWASVEHVVEHDANIQPGNSGGPLVDAETGKVVAVNYAGGDVGGTGTSQFFAIASDLAQPLVEQLKEGDVDSLGINGQAVYDSELGIAGIWVSGVDTNSPAGELGIQGGDLIERIEGLSMGSDGTLADYCDVLKSRNADDKLSVQVLRFDEQLRLTGEFNGDELEPSESLATEVVAQTGALQSGMIYPNYVRVSDNSGVISVEVPGEWSDVDGSPHQFDDGTQWANVMASPSVAGYEQQWDMPGVMVTAASAADVGGDLNSVLDAYAEGAMGACTDGGREVYDDTLYQGFIQYLGNCGGTGASAVYIVASPAGGSFVALVQVQMVTDADILALDKVIATFMVNL